MEGAFYNHKIEILSMCFLRVANDLTALIELKEVENKAIDLDVARKYDTSVEPHNLWQQNQVDFLKAKEIFTSQKGKIIMDENNLFLIHDNGILKALLW